MPEFSALTPLTSASGTGDQQLATSPTSVKGFSARESAVSSSTASFALRNGTSSSAPGVIFVEFNANESITFEFSNPLGIEFRSGIYLDRISGTTEVAVWV